MINTINYILPFVALNSASPKSSSVFCNRSRLFIFRFMNRMGIYFVWLDIEAEVLDAGRNYLVLKLTSAVSNDIRSVI